MSTATALAGTGDAAQLLQAKSVIAFLLLLASKSLTISQFSSNELLYQRQYM